MIVEEKIKGKCYRKSDMMRKLFYVILILLLFFSFFVMLFVGVKKLFKVFNFVVSILKENMYLNVLQDQLMFQLSKLVKELLDILEINIENLYLIKMLNEIMVFGLLFVIGYWVKIFFGKWVFGYQLNEMVVNWEYKKININRVDNWGGQ